jgi:hypothetical protein
VVRAWQAVGAAAAVFLSAWAAPPAVGTSVVVSAGVGLTVAAPTGDFALVVPVGTVGSAGAGFGPFSVTDARGTGAGWTVTIQGTPLRAWDGSGYLPGGGSLPPGSLTLSGLAVAADGTDSPPPLVAAGPYTLDRTVLTVAHAPPGTGMGSYTFRPTAGLHVTLPMGASPGTYRSEVSISVTSGP